MKRVPTPNRLRESSNGWTAVWLVASAAVVIVILATMTLDSHSASGQITPALASVGPTPKDPTGPLNGLPPLPAPGGATPTAADFRAGLQLQALHIYLKLRVASGDLSACVSNCLHPLDEDLNSALSLCGRAVQEADALQGEARFSGSEFEPLSGSLKKACGRLSEGLAQLGAPSDSASWRQRTAEARDILLPVVADKVPVPFSTPTRTPTAPAR